MSPVTSDSPWRPPLDEQLRAVDGFPPPLNVEMHDRVQPQSSSSNWPSNGTNAELLEAVEAELTRRTEIIEAMVDMIRSEPTPNGDA